MAPEVSYELGDTADMPDDRWHRIEDLFHRAADLAPGERERFLDSECAGDPELREEVQSLLAADVGSEGVLEVAVAEAAEQLSAEVDGDALPIGKRIGAYSIVGLIGKGGMGAVYRAVRDGEFRMEVALKLLKRGTDTDSALSHFRKERQILAGLQHPNVARLLDGGATDDGLPYFAMEYVDGRPLLEYAAPLSIRRRLELFRSVCAAVQYAHQNLIVHRDLKPGNILVTAEVAPKLLDFGIAKLLDPGSDSRDLTLTVAGARLMTPDYASPEQIRGEPVTTATDVYSLGVILYELLTGERPHRIEIHSPEAIERAICREEPRRPSTINRQLDPDLDNIILMALRKEPQRRYASVEQLSADVRRYLEGRPVRARKDTLGYRATKFIRRNRIGVGAVALVGIGVAASIVAVNRQARRAEYRFQQVRKLAHSVLFDLNPQIENLAGSTKAREQLVKTSLEYLDSLAAEGGNDPALRQELAQAYEKVGDVQGDPKGRNLGQEEAALKSYGKAISIAGKLDRSKTALELMARSYSKIGAVQRFALANLVGARENLRRAVEVAASIPSKTGAPAYQIRADVYGILGDVDVASNLDRASDPYKRSLAIAREWVAAAPSAESRGFLSRAIARWGNVLWLTGNLPEARDSMITALRMTEALREEEPANAVWRMRRAHLSWQIGMITGYPMRFNLGDTKTSAAWLREAVEESQSLAADRYDEWARYTGCEAAGALAAVVGESEPARAEPMFRRSLALGDALLRISPADVDFKDGQAERRMGLASVLRKLGRNAEALPEVLNAVEVLRALHEQNPALLYLGDDLAAALLGLAACRLELGDGGGAEHNLQETLRLLKTLQDQNSRDLRLLRDLANCHQGFGDLAARRSDWAQARAEYQKSLDLWESWKQVGVSSVYDQRHRDAAAELVARAASKASKTPPSR